ncbi:hypothetical protein [Streptomyces sp. SAS_260]|uniref:hypothetical protein n=1 Tax=Streptomyces sp. SAS_260 TaxID=3412751 RepID=UPI00403CB4A7
MDIPSESVPTVTQELFRRAVAAVRDGEDENVRTLLERLADVADTRALLLLREQLNKDLTDDDSADVTPALPAPQAHV